MKVRQIKENFLLKIDDQNSEPVEMLSFCHKPWRLSKVVKAAMVNVGKNQDSPVVAISKKSMSKMLQLVGQTKSMVCLYFHAQNYIFVQQTLGRIQATLRSSNETRQRGTRCMT